MTRPASIDIEAPVQDVWDVAADLSRFGDWVSEASDPLARLNVLAGA